MIESLVKSAAGAVMFMFLMGLPALLFLIAPSTPGNEGSTRKAGEALTLLVLTTALITAAIWILRN